MTAPKEDTLVACEPRPALVSVEGVHKEAERLGADTSLDTISALVGSSPYVVIRDLRAGYGKMEILHGINLQVARGQSLCLIGPNGAGKSTVLHSIYGFTDVFSGEILVGEGANARDITRLPANRKLGEAGVAYILQDKSVFPGMTVEENLWMGGYLLAKQALAKQAAEKIFDRYPTLAERRNQPAGVLSGGERRLLEISRALVMDPDILLVDEPSIGLAPRYIDMVFDILGDLQRKDGKTIIIVEQNAKKGLEFADIAYVLVAGRLAIAGTGEALLANPDVGRLFLGG